MSVELTVHTPPSYSEQISTDVESQALLTDTFPFILDEFNNLSFFHDKTLSAF